MTQAFSEKGAIHFLGRILWNAGPDDPEAALGEQMRAAWPEGPPDYLIGKSLATIRALMKAKLESAWAEHLQHAVSVAQKALGEGGEGIDIQRADRMLELVDIQREGQAHWYPQIPTEVQFFFDFVEKLDVDASQYLDEILEDDPPRGFYECMYLLLAFLADEQDWLYKKAQEAAEYRRRAEQANRRAEQERRRAEQERQHIEALKAKVAELTARLEAQGSPA